MSHTMKSFINIPSTEDETENTRGTEESNGGSEKCQGFANAISNDTNAGNLAGSSLPDNAVTTSKTLNRKTRSGTPIFRDPKYQRHLKSDDVVPNESSSEVLSTTHLPTSCSGIMHDNCYSVTSGCNKVDGDLAGQNKKSFISIHSTDQYFQDNNNINVISSASCNLEVLSLNEIFPSTSEESIGKLEDSYAPKANLQTKYDISGCKDNVGIKPISILNSKSTTSPRKLKNILERYPRKSDNNFPRTSLIDAGSTLGDSKMRYHEQTPKKMTKQMKKFLRHQEKYKSRDLDRKMNELVLRGILKDYRLPSEYPHDTPQEGADDSYYGVVSADLGSESHFSKQFAHLDKAVKFNAQVMVIHFTGGECGKIIGQSVETLSKEKDQQARNSELRKSYSVFRMRQYNALLGSNFID